MAANNLPLEFILTRSLNEGFVKADDPSLQRAQLSLRTVPRLDDEGADQGTSKATGVPLSKNDSIYYQKIGLLSTRRSKPTSRSSSFSTINGSGRQNSKAEALSTQQYRAPPRGYGLADFSSSEEEYDEVEGQSSDDSEYDTSDSEEEVFPVAPHRTAKPGAHLAPVDRTKLEMAHYVAHVTGRMDPWDLKMRKMQEEGKEGGSQIAERIVNDFKNLEMNAISSASWARDNSDIVRRMKETQLEVEQIKERRKKETQDANQKLAKEIEDCLTRIKEERETVIRIREEAIKQAQAEKDRLAQEAEAKKKAEQDKKEMAAAQAVAAEADKAKKREAAVAASAATAAQASANTNAIFVSEAASAEYQGYIQTLERIRTEVLPSVTNNPQLKKFCFGARREIVASIGQLVNKQQEIYRVASEIDQYFKNTKSHDQNAYLWVLNCAAKKLVKQAETEALVKSAPTFPLALVAVLLFPSHPVFLQVLMARFAKKCPYVTPLYIQQNPNDTADEAAARLSYKKTGKGYESEAQYNARQCAIFTLYCAILQTTIPNGQNVHGLSYGWTWMARIMNMPPRPITPSLINVFLEVCGNAYLRAYPNQSQKVLRLLIQDFIPLIPKQGIDGTTRLTTLLDDYRKKGTIPVAEGRNPTR